MIFPRRQGWLVDQAVDEDGAPRLLTLREMEAEHIRHVLVLCGGNISKAATVLGIFRSSLQRKMRAHGLR
jgi:ActR/RegA family two-component response regulator